MKPIQKLKSAMLSSFLALNKVEQDALREIIEETGTQKEQEQKKDYIKIISKRRFYEILDRADQYINERNKDYLIAQYEKRNLANKELIVSNKETILNEGTRVIRERIQTNIACDNAILDQVASHLYVSSGEDNKKVIEFVVDKIAFPGASKATDKFTVISNVVATHNNKIYEYNITHFLGLESDRHSIIVKYLGDVVKEGESALQLDDEERIMRKEDLLDDKSIYIGRDQFFNPKSNDDQEIL